MLFCKLVLGRTTSGPLGATPPFACCDPWGCWRKEWLLLWSYSWVIAYLVGDGGQAVLGLLFWFIRKERKKHAWLSAVNILLSLNYSGLGGQGCLCSELKSGEEWGKAAFHKESPSHVEVVLWAGIRGGKEQWCYVLERWGALETITTWGTAAAMMQAPRGLPLGWCPTHSLLVMLLLQKMKMRQRR